MTQNEKLLWYIQNSLDYLDKIWQDKWVRTSRTIQNTWDYIHYVSITIENENTWKKQFFQEYNTQYKKNDKIKSYIDDFVNIVLRIYNIL